MPDHSRQQRQSAAREFMQSLGQLETVLQPEANLSPTSPEPVRVPRPVAPPPRPTRGATQTDLAAAFEEAAADIEQFMNIQEEMD